MDPCWKTTSSISEDLKELPTLLQLSDVIFDNNQCKGNDSIFKIEVDGCDIEQIDKSISICMAANVKTNVPLLHQLRRLGLLT